jgi:hypothetical protein
MELTHKNLTLRQISELFLQEIYKDYQDHKGQNYTHIGEIAKLLGFKENDDRIIQATSLLDEAGYLECETMVDGISLVKLTPKAILHIEETNDLTVKNVGNMPGQTIINYFNNPNKSQININSPNSTQNININELEKTLTSIEKIITEHEHFRKEERQDYLTDIRILREELTKSNPNKSFLKGKLELLAKIAPIATLVNTLITLLAL